MTEADHPGRRRQAELDASPVLGRGARGAGRAGRFVLAGDAQALGHWLARGGDPNAILHPGQIRRASSAWQGAHSESLAGLAAWAGQAACFEALLRAGARVGLPGAKASESTASSIVEGLVSACRTWSPRGLSERVLAGDASAAMVRAILAHAPEALFEMYSPPEWAAQRRAPVHRLAERSECAGLLEGALHACPGRAKALEADARVRVRLGTTCVEHANREGLEVVLRCLGPALANAENARGFTALGAALQRGDALSVETLLRGGVALRCGKAIGGRFTPLAWAVCGEPSGRHVDRSVESLLAAGADPRGREPGSGRPTLEVAEECLARDSRWVGGALRKAVESLRAAARQADLAETCPRREGGVPQTEPEQGL